MSRRSYVCCAKAVSIVAVAAVSMSFATYPASSEAAHGVNETNGIATPCERHLSPESDLFRRENDTAMRRMMTDMMVPSSGNIDRDFAVMMIAHHRGAIDMAKAYLRSGSNAALLRMAQEIIIMQQQEIAVMQHAVDAGPPPSNSTAQHCAPD